jgi:predicted transglutaminase-like cysteine proteinase
MQAEGTRLPASDRSLRGAMQSGKLLEAMGAYRDEKRVELAKQVTDWSQRIARRYYKFDPGRDDPAWDYWPTVGELLGNNGDDCDGLDLIAYQMLREFGFPMSKVYRGIVRRDRDGANHMVTLWFEDPRDPWVLDATGAVTFSMRRFSELEGWTPTKVFNDREQYLAVGGARSPAVARGE